MRAPRQTVRLRGRAATRRGATVVEMALAAPILLLVTFGLFEFGYAFMVQHLMQDAAREGCRIAVFPRSTNTAVLDNVNQSLQSKGINGAATTILVNNAAGDVSKARPGDRIRVQISVPTSSVSIIPSGFLSGQLTASFSRRHE